ncbi:MAG: hypothetical protein B7Z81_03065 [Acidocella sp. 20-61-6]|nr:MAG: hypothetical protein B7Z81_03065 [Acidocella sp. 20-61-6]
MARANSVQYLLGTKFYKMAYVEFGNPAAPAVLCVHGLTRNGRDFDMLAAALEDRFHVICPDLPGRGKSDWLAEPMAYQPPSYVVALSHLLAALGKPVSWVGTSLGGICGMMVAAAQNTPIKRMVLNDVGPLIPAASLKRIRDYMVGAPERFANMATLEAHLREVHAPFGKLTDAQWAHMARYSARSVLDQTGAGTLAMHFDPKIIEPMRGTVPLDVDLWPLWEMIKMPLLTIRDACLAVAKAKWEDVDPDEVRLPFRERDDDEKNEYLRGKVTVTAKSQYKPAVVDAKRKPVPDDIKVRGGDVCKASVVPVPYEQTETVTEGKKRKTVKIYGVALQLRAVQLIEKRAGAGGGTDVFDDEEGFEADSAAAGGAPDDDGNADF